MAVVEVRVAGNGVAVRFARWFKICVCAAGLLQFGFGCAYAQSEAKARNANHPGAKEAANASAVSSLMLSDIHFEPFWDPDKVVQLAAAPATQWHAILASASSANQQQQFASLQQKCHTRGNDTSFGLFQSSIRAMQTNAGNARFVTISGDLIAHAFTCKYNALMPKSTPNDYRAFVKKTIDYELTELRAAFKEVPVYAALGNNDSDCGDYQLDSQSAFLRDLAPLMTADIAGSGRNDAEQSFTKGGYFSVALPAMRHPTRLLVLDDLYMSRKYSTCGGKPDATAASTEIAWLQQQLSDAREHTESIWVMGHIPPGIDPYSTARKMKNVCAGQAPEMFLSSETLADTLVNFSDVVRLALFAHTHMDEMRLLGTGDAGAEASKHIALKMVPSISPVDGNNPSFIVAQVDPTDATLKDYRVIAASGQEGDSLKWSEEYDFAKTFNQTEYSPNTLQKLAGGFRADSGASTPESESYLRDYFVGDRSQVLKMFWPEYTCAITNHNVDSYRSCICSTTPEPRTR